MTEVYAVAATAAENEDLAPDPQSVGPGSLGFWIVIGLIVVLFLLYKSMRKQIRRVDFDTDATTDEERVASHHEPDDDREKHDHRS